MYDQKSTFCAWKPFHILKQPPPLSDNIMEDIIDNVLLGVGVPPSLLQSVALKEDVIYVL